MLSFLNIIYLLTNPLKIGKFHFGYFMFLYSKFLRFAVNACYLPNLILLRVYAGRNVRDACDSNPKSQPTSCNSLLCKHRVPYNTSNEMESFGEGRMENRVGSLREKHWKSSFAFHKFTQVRNSSKNGNSKTTRKKYDVMNQIFVFLSPLL